MMGSWGRVSFKTKEMILCHVANELRDKAKDEHCVRAENLEFASWFFAHPLADFTCN
jgi:hypothetical protein